VEYSKAMWQYASQKQIPLIYASSAATYGAGEHGYDDRHDILDQLNPLNPYGVSKNEFDKWALQQNANGNITAPSAWTGLKFFNV
jgi:ADP-L-glycero-D-manno-heptose 6-epimerase